MKRTATAMAFQREITNNPKSDIRISEDFDAQFLENWPKIYCVLLRLVGDPDEAEDLALETFLRLYRQRPEEVKGSIGGWLYRVATHLGLNAIRSWNRREKYELHAGRLDWAIRQPENPAELFADEEERRRVRDILSTMNTRQAQLLTLRYSGMTYKEIADILTVEPTSIGPLLVRAETEFEKRFCAMKGEGG
ncbi:MAG: sigma-70 family RNA polymerase sigma factor [Anaerolineaceae bacterium]